MSRLAAALVAVALASAGCADGDGSAGQRELNSVIVGADHLISDDASEFVDLAGLAARSIAADLEAFWAAADGAARMDRDVELRVSIDRIEDTVDQLDDAFDTVTDEHVRATYRPFLTAHRDLLDALEDVRAGLLEGDEARRADGLADYEAARRTIAALDRARLDRVIAAYGPEEARRLLEEAIAEGADRDE